MNASTITKTKRATSNVKEAAATTLVTRVVKMQAGLGPKTASLSGLSAPWSKMRDRLE